MHYLVNLDVVTATRTQKQWMFWLFGKGQITFKFEVFSFHLLGLYKKMLFSSPQ